MKFNIRISLGLFLLSLALSITEAGNFLTDEPEKYGLNTCFLDDVELSKCLVKVLQTIFVKWKDGPPGTNIGPVDPFSIKELKVSSKTTKNSSDPIFISADLQNIIVRGTSNTTFLEANYDPEKNEAKVILQIPKLDFDFDYKIKGNLLHLNVDEQGKGHMEIGNILMVLEAIVNPLITPEAKFFTVKQIKVSFREVFNFKIKLDNLFEGNEQLNKSTHELLNNNFSEFYKTWRPAIENMVETIVTDRSRKIFSYVPATYVFYEPEWSELLKLSMKQSSH